MNEDEELELELEMAKAKASAKKKKSNVPPDTSEVARQAAIRGPASIIDSAVTGVVTAPQMIYGVGATMAGRPDLAPNVESAETPVQDFLTNNKNVPSGLKLDPQATEGMTDPQKVIDAVVSGATSGLLGRGKAIANAALAGSGAGVGELVSQVTGDPILGMAAALFSPMAATKAIPQIGMEKRIKEIQNAIRDKTIKEANGIGMIAIPDSKLAAYSNKEELIKAAGETNQQAANNAARRALGLPKDSSLDEKTINALRTQAYQTGYEPLKRLGTNPVYVDPVTGAVPFLDDLVTIETKYTGAQNTFPDAAPKALGKLFTTYMQGTLDAADVVDTIKRLRHEATAVFSKNNANPKDEEIAFAKKAIADAFEGELERQAVAQGLGPQVIENYKNARKAIAVSHTVEDVLEMGSGRVLGHKLAAKYQKGDYITGDLGKVAAFYNIHRPEPATTQQLVNAYFMHAAGFATAGAAGVALGLPAGSNAAIALAGAAGYGLAREGMQAAGRKFITSKMGQSKAMDYSKLGPSQMAPALSGLGYFSSIDSEENK